MAQNRISLQLSPDQLARAYAAMTELEAVFSGLISLSPDERRQLTKMGRKSESFCRDAIVVGTQNPQIIPPSLDIAEANADVRAWDDLRPLSHRLAKLAEKAADTEMALGSDIMSAALELYALLKSSGKQQGLDGQRRELGVRWSKRRSVEVPDPEEDPA